MVFYEHKLKSAQASLQNSLKATYRIDAGCSSRRPSLVQNVGENAHDAIPIGHGRNTAHRFVEPLAQSAAEEDVIVRGCWWMRWIGLPRVVFPTSGCTEREPVPKRRIGRLCGHGHGKICVPRGRKLVEQELGPDGPDRLVVVERLDVFNKSLDDARFDARGDHATKSKGSRCEALCLEGVATVDTRRVVKVNHVKGLAERRAEVLISFALGVFTQPVRTCEHE